MSEDSESQPAQSPPPVAFVSGHLDLDQETFNTHYASSLNAAIATNHSFILSSSRGADALALEHLLAAGTPAERITVYLNTPLPPKPAAKGNKKGKKGPSQTNRRDPTPELIQKFTDLGVGVRMVSGDHERRDTVMTKESDYDVLWVRPEAATRELYGSKYRAGRVSGTERNRLRREVGGIGRRAVGRRGIAEGGEEGEGEMLEGEIPKGEVPTTEVLKAE